MKIRTNFVSNSSSSSFVVCGNDLKQILEQYKNDNTAVYYQEEWYKDSLFSYGDVHDELLYQRERNRAETTIKSVLFAKFDESVRRYVDSYYWNKIANRKCYCFDWNDVSDADAYDVYIKDSSFALSQQVLDYLNNFINEVYKTKDKNSQTYWINYDENSELRRMLFELVDKVYNQLKEQYNDIFVVSAGDNHGDCDGHMGSFIEYEYLGHNEISQQLNTNINIISVNEH